METFITWNQLIRLGAIAGINYKEDLDFGDKIMEITEGKGVNMILDCVSGGPNWV